MKTTKRQLKRIIKEEISRNILIEKKKKQKLLREAGKEHVWPEVEFPAVNPYDDSPQGPPVHMSGRNQGVMDQLHTAIDALIGALGNEGARQELLGIVEDWEREEVYEGTSPDNMPSSWKQILKDCLKSK